MNNCIFTDNNGNRYKRITRPQAKKAYNNGENIFICACNLRPFSFYHSASKININDINEPIFINGILENDFSRRINEFEFYNCSNETGRYTAFYIAI